MADYNAIFRQISRQTRPPILKSVVFEAEFLLKSVYHVITIHKSEKIQVMADYIGVCSQNLWITANLDRKNLWITANLDIKNLWITAKYHTFAAIFNKLGVL